MPPQIAMRAERDAVKAAGVSWWAYQSFMKKHEKQIEEEKLVRSSPVLRLYSAVNHDPDTHRSPEPTEMIECRSDRADGNRAGPSEPHARAAAIPHRFSSWAANDI